MSDFFSTAEDQVREYSSRYRYLYFAIGLLSALFFFRLWYLQILQGSELRIFSEKNRLKETKIAAPRGIVFDRENKILVENRTGFEVTLQPQYVTDLQKTAEMAGQILGIQPSRIVSLVQKSRRQNGPFRPVKIKDNLSREEVFQLKMMRIDYPGMDISETVVRSYPLMKNGSQLFGYVGEISKKQLPLLNARAPNSFEQGDIIGKSGLEEIHDTLIRGHDGVSVVQVDARGRDASLEAPSFLGALGQVQDAKPGNSLVLTIDKDVQEVAYKAFVETGRIGAVVAMRPNGEVIAWVNAPSFDPNTFSTRISGDLWSQLVNDPFRPMRNKVVQDAVSPGSTFKAIVALAGLEEGIINPSTTHFCPGFYKFGRRVYHCHQKHGHGEVNVYQALERSCDVFFYKVGLQLGVDRIAKYSQALGLGKLSGVDIRNEVAGLIPTSEWKRAAYGEEWQPGENLSTAIGQGFVSTTALQMAGAYSVIASDGFLYKPYLVQKVLDPSGKLLHEYGPQLIRDLSENSTGGLKISRKNFEVVKEGLHLVANGNLGTAKFWKIPGLEFSGKTGTTQLRSFTADQIYKRCEDRPISHRHHGWFIGYAPPDQPKIVVSVLAEHSCHGNMGGVPVARDIIAAYMKKYHPELVKTPQNGPKVIDLSPEVTDE